MAKPEQIERANVIEVQADLAGRDLLHALVDELRLLPKPWPALPETEQEEIIERLRKRITHMVRSAVAAIAADGNITVEAELETLRYKKKSHQALLRLGEGFDRSELVSRLGHGVVIVCTDASRYLTNIGEVKADPDQAALDLQAAADAAIKKAKRDGDGLLG